MGATETGSIEYQVFTEPATRDNLGEYTMQILSCVNYGDPALGQKNCQEGEPFVIDVIDPCFSTSIISSIFTDVME